MSRDRKCLDVLFRSLVVLSAVGLFLLTDLTIARAQLPNISVVEAGQQRQEESIPLPPEANTPEALFEFLDSLGEMEPEGKSDEEMIAYQQKIFRTVANASNKILGMKMTDEQAVEANFYRMQALQYLMQLGDESAGPALQQAIAAALADSRTQVQEIGMKFNIELGLASWSQLNDQQKSDLIDGMIGFISKGTPDESKLQMVMTVVDYLGDSGGAAHAKVLLDAAIALYKQRGDEKFQEAMPLLEGISRRLGLPGNPIRVEGTLLDGTEFDWASYRGKVVLVDFWATWCGPCRAEVPNVLRLYRAYHDKGFDVVGISLDKSPEDAQQYIQQTGIPWVTLFSQNDEERGWEHPLALYYGITGIPRAILVDKAGNVVSMMARGPILERELRKLLGEPLTETSDSASAQQVQVAKPVVEEQAEGVPTTANE